MNQPAGTAHRPIGFTQIAVLTAAFLGWMFDGLEMGLFPLVAAPAFGELLGSTEKAVVGPWIGYVTCAFLLGAAAGGLLFGWLGDRIGRVKAMSLSILAYAVFTGICYFATAPWHLVVMRFLAALGMGGEWALGVALVMECWPSKYRPLLAGFIGAASNVGFLLIALVGLTFAELGQSWRLMMIAGAAPAILTVFIQALVPESAAWKETKQAHRIGPDPLVEVFGPSLRGKTLVAVALGGVALLGTWGSVQWIPTWVREELLAHEPTSRAKAVGAYMSQIASALGAIVGCFVGPWLGHRFGRRPVYFGLCVASLIVCQLTFLNFKEYGWPLLGMVLLAGMTTASFYGWLPLYLPELFPTRVRATGQGFAFNGGRVLAALGVIFTGQLVASMGYSRAGAVISGVYIVGMLAVWLAPETKGKPMPE